MEEKTVSDRVIEWYQLRSEYTSRFTGKKNKVKCPMCTRIYKRTSAKVGDGAMFTFEGGVYTGKCKGNDKHPPCDGIEIEIPLYSDKTSINRSLYPYIDSTLAELYNLRDIQRATGTLSPERREQFDELYERYTELLTFLDVYGSSSPPEYVGEGFMVEDVRTETTGGANEGSVVHHSNKILVPEGKRLKGARMGEMSLLKLCADDLPILVDVPVS